MAGRPTKMTDTLIQAFAEVVEENILYATDEELFMLLNDRLNNKDQISYTTFKGWKNQETQKHNPLYSTFLSLIKKALQKEKRRLLKKLQDDDKAWQRWAWIIERKFDEWNIRQKSDVDLTSKGQQITGMTIK